MVDKSLEELPLDGLANSMRNSKWQRTELDRIKSEPGYKIASLCTRVLSQLLGANLYSQIEPDPAGVPPDSGTSPSYRRNKLSSQRAKLAEANELAFGSRRELSPLVLAGRLLLIVFLASLMMLSSSTHYQYLYDTYKHHLDKFRAASGGIGAPARASDTLNYYNERNITEAKLVAWLAEAQTDAASVGSFLLELAMLAECAYLLMMSLCVVLYLCPILYYRFVRPQNLYFMRMQLDWDREQMNCNLIIQETVEMIVRSSKNFTDIQMDRHRQLSSMANSIGGRHRPHEDAQANAVSLQDAGKQPICRAARWLDSNRTPLNDTLDGRQLALLFKSLLTREHQWIELRLKQLALGGQLQPLDRRNIKQVASGWLLQVIFMVVSCVSCFIWNICLFTLLPFLFGFSYKWGLMDIVSMLNLYGHNILLTISGAYYFSHYFLFCYNQTINVGNLIEMISSFRLLDGANARKLFEAHRRRQMDVRVSPFTGEARAGPRPRRWRWLWSIKFSTIVSRRFTKGHPYDSSRTTCSYDQLNEQLLLILVHYKLLLAQIRQTKNTFRLAIILNLIVMILFPILVRLHTPYGNYANSDILALIVCLILIGLPDLILLPLCWLNTHFMKLNKHFYSLLASLAASKHKLATKAPAGADLSIGLYNEHTIWMIRRELFDSVQFRRKFRVNALGFQLSFGAMLKFHLWLGILIVALLAGFRSGPNSSLGSIGRASGWNSRLGSSLASDPLGVEHFFDEQTRDRV